MKNINPNNFPDIDSIRVFHTIKDDLEKKMSIYPQTLDRANGAVSLSFYFCLEDERLYCKNKLNLREVFLRASLAEFVSMEDTLERDIRNLNINLPVLKLNDSSNPLLHILRELRNLEIHLSSSMLSKKEKEYYWQPDGEWQKITSAIWHINNLTPDSFLSLRNIKMYDERMFLKAADIFINSQLEWGISELILRAVEIYCQEIIAYYP